METHRQRIINDDYCQQEEICAIASGAVESTTKITYQELADCLGIDEQKVKQYEETDYQQASFSELLKVSEVLAIELESISIMVDFTELVRCKKITERYTTESQH